MPLLKYITHYAICTLFIFSCASTKKDVDSHFENIIQDNHAWIKATGKVSDMYASKGCGFIILNIRKKEKDTLILIPSSPLTGFKKNNLAIKFSYRILKTHTKKGCVPGIPVQIMEIKKQKN